MLWQNRNYRYIQSKTVVIFCKKKNKKQKYRIKYFINFGDDIKMFGQIIYKNEKTKWTIFSNYKEFL